MTAMLSQADCLAKAASLERQAEAAPESGRNYAYFAAAWRRLAQQSEWQDRMLAVIARGSEFYDPCQIPSGKAPSRLPIPSAGITCHHPDTPDRIAFTGAERPGGQCAGASRQRTGKTAIGSWRQYLAHHHV